VQLGFVSAILAELNLEDVLAFAAEEGFACVELMSWPPGAADRRYAGVTHIDASTFTTRDAERINKWLENFDVAISALGYYPNPLHPEPAQRRQFIDHLKKVISAAALMGMGIVNTFIGRDPHKSIPENWTGLQSVWPEIINHAEKEKIRVGIENCPMLFTLDEWPGGSNLAVSPAIWRKLFQDIPSPNLGLNFDPSHLVWQHIDYLRALREFGQRIVHVHAKDTRIDQDRLYEHGVLGLGWHTPKLPGLGDVAWGKFFSALTDAGYRGAVCIEVEDRAFEASLDDRKRALRQSKRFLEPLVS
jgi:sugar phosphate isomerase/epimerase